MTTTTSTGLDNNEDNNHEHATTTLPSITMTPVQEVDLLSRSVGRGSEYESAFLMQDSKRIAASYVRPSSVEQQQQQQQLQQPTELLESSRQRMILQVAGQPLPPPPEIHYYGLALVFMAPALGGFLYGYDIGATSFALAMMRNARDHDVWWHGFPKYQQGLLVSTLALGALLGSHIVLVYMANNVGRRKEIRIAAALYVVGAMLNVMSGTMLATTQKYQYGLSVGLATLITGRILYGAGVGFIMHGAPTYMAEMSPSQVRGAIVSAKETVIVFGIVVGMLMGDLMSDYPDDWTNLYAISILGAIPMLLLTFKIPRSKRWLIMKGYHEEAKESMQFVYKGNIEDEFERMAETIGSMCCRNNDDVQDVRNTNSEDETSLAPSVYDNGDGQPIETTKSTEDDQSSTGGKEPSLWKARYRSVMTIGVALLVSQQFSGQPSVLAYSRVLFQAAGWQGHTSVVTVIIMGVTSAFTVGLVDRLGRKKLLVAGCVIMASSLGALTYGFWGWDDNSNTKLSHFRQNLVLWGMFIYIAGYQVGYGPITWTVLSEIYPTEIRGTAMAFSVEVNFLSKFLCQLFFPLIQDSLGWGSTFILFACILLCSLTFILFKVPETKGLSLEEIQLKLRGIEREKENVVKETTFVKTSTCTKLDSPLLEDDLPLAARGGLTPIV